MGSGARRFDCVFQASQQIPLFPKGYIGRLPARTAFAAARLRARARRPHGITTGPMLCRLPRAGGCGPWEM